jgi:tetratricopeptide (TPR) repeat protein
MSKKSRRKKQTGLTHYGKPPGQLRAELNLSDRIEYARQQMVVGDFPGAISTCTSLLIALPERRSSVRVELLMIQGLAHGMLEHYQQSYDIFSEAIGLDPAVAELWFNRGLACTFMSRPAEAVQNFEHALELLPEKTSTIAHKFAAQLRESRQELQEVIESCGTDVSIAQYTQREQCFTRALGLVRQEHWPEAEQLFRQLTETGARIPSYWGNLGVCLMIQSRYTEAEEALKQALAIDPDYEVARDNLKKLSIARRSNRPLAHYMVNAHQDSGEKQSLALYEKNEQGDVISNTVVERVGHVVTSTWRQFGKLPPRYDFFLNRDRDTRFTTCPRCQSKTQARKFSLVILVGSGYALVVEKTCRFCASCDLLIVHQDQLETQLTRRFLQINRQAIGSDYQVVGTLDKAQWQQLGGEQPSFAEIREYLYDFKETVTF